MAIALDNKLVFITGASAGFGAATAREFARHRCRLLLCARRVEKLQSVADECRQLGAPAVHAFELDVRDYAAVNAAWNALPAEWQTVDILVNNAGLSRGLMKQYEDNVQNWEEMIDTNVKGLLYVTRAVVPGMVARNSGHVINLGSIAGHTVYPSGSVYCATKAAERFLTDGLRIDLNGTDIRTTSIDPGLAETEFSQVRFRGDTARAAKTYEDIIPLTAEDIADTILWAATRPPHVNIQTVILTCVAQANPYVITRKTGGK